MKINKPVQFAGRTYAPTGSTEKSGCGANAKGGGGFQPGNSCGGESGGGSEGKAQSQITAKSTQAEMEKATEHLKPMLTHQGEKYTQTGKVGYNFAEKQAAREYESIDDDGKRVWMTADKKVKPD
jgi:hypothetical protein